MLSLEPHDKHILNVGYCQGARLHHPGPPLITPLGERLSHKHFHHGNRVSDLPFADSAALQQTYSCHGF